jgi:hypothetical protein
MTIPIDSLRPFDDGPGTTKRKRKWPQQIMFAGAVLVALLAGVGIGSAARQHTVYRTVYQTKDVTVPGPAVTKTVQAAPPPAGTVIGTWSGTGNQVTPAFNAPANGDYVVSWTYSNNNDPSLGGATNFAITATDSNATALGLPNDIAASGSGSTEVTGASGVESFNVQAAGSWTIKVVSAP